MLRKVASAPKYFISRFWTHKPVILTHSVTSQCNSMCKICDVWRTKHNTREMTTREIFRMLTEARKLRFVAYVVFGGEPLMRTDILDVLRCAHDLGFYTSIITNGVYLPEKADEIAKTVDLTWVSLDHYSNYHDELRGLKGTFKKAFFREFPFSS